VLDYILYKGKKVKCSRYRPGVAQRVGRGIALLFHDRGTRRGCVVSSTRRPHFTPRKDPVPILHEAGWAPGPVWTGGKSRHHRDSIPDRPARSSVAIPTELPGSYKFTNVFAGRGLHSHLYQQCYIIVGGAGDGAVGGALRYKPEGRGFDSRRCLGSFIDVTLPAELWSWCRISL